MCNFVLHLTFLTVYQHYSNIQWVFFLFHSNYTNLRISMNRTSREIARFLLKINGFMRWWFVRITSTIQKSRFTASCPDPDNLPGEGVGVRGIIKFVREVQCIFLVYLQRIFKKKYFSKEMRTHLTPF